MAQIRQQTPSLSAQKIGLTVFCTSLDDNDKNKNDNDKNNAKYTSYYNTAHSNNMFLLSSYNAGVDPLIKDGHLPLVDLTKWQLNDNNNSNNNTTPLSTCDNDKPNQKEEEQEEEEQQQLKCRQRIKFAQNLEDISFTIHINDYTEEEKLATWYDTTEFANFRIERCKILRRLEQQESNDSDSDSDDCDYEDDDDDGFDVLQDRNVCFRGLESKTKSGQRKRTKNISMAVQAVLEEQAHQQSLHCQRGGRQRQRSSSSSSSSSSRRRSSLRRQRRQQQEKGGGENILDSDRISSIYMMQTQNCLLEARARGRNDELSATRGRRDNQTGSRRRRR